MLNEDKFTTVPVISMFGQDDVIGELKIETKYLPKTPTYVFSLGFITQEDFESSGTTYQSKPYTGAYILKNISIIDDVNYAKYLRQIGVV